MRPAPGTEPAAGRTAADGGGEAAGDRPLLAGGSQELDEAVAHGERRTHWEVAVIAVVAAIAVIAGGVYPEPLFDLVRQAGESFPNLL